MIGNKSGQGRQSIDNTSLKIQTVLLDLLPILQTTIKGFLNDSKNKRRKSVNSKNKRRG